MSLSNMCDICAILIPFALVGLSSMSVFVWQRYYTKYIVVTMNTELGIRVHSIPMSYNRAKEKVKKFSEQLNRQRLAGHPVARRVFMLRFDIMHETSC